MLVNLSLEEVVVEHGERIFQMIINKQETAEWIEVETLEESDRGSGGLDHTGKKQKRHLWGRAFL